jgi:methionyl aminopeptidase
MSQSDQIQIKTPEDITLLRQGGRILATILDELEQLAVPGNTTQDIEDRAMELVEEYQVEPMILGYHPDFAPRPYPASTCVSVNDVLVHGIPNEQPQTFLDGDVVSVDMVIAHKGMVVDSARTVGVGAISHEAKELLEVTREALRAGIAAAQAGNQVRDIGAAIERVVPKGFGIVEVLCGHGVGYSVHEPPNVPNYVMSGSSPELRPGMVLAIEPMIVAGSKHVTFDSGDGYTVYTKNGALGAHMEHTVLITKKGPEILTKK